MPEKRKLSARLRDGAAKRRVSTPVEPTPVEEIEESEPPEETVPTKVDTDSPLPTIMSGMSLGDQSTQSIAESGVLAESMSRSHQVWMTENLFEHYWTKPSKKKSKIEDSANNPTDKQSKIGTCRILIEPHILDATIYAIKQPNTSGSTNTPKTKILQYNPPVSNMSHVQQVSPAPNRPLQAQSQIQQQTQVASQPHAPTNSTQPNPAPSQPAASTANSAPPQPQPQPPIVKIERPAPQVPTQPSQSVPKQGHDPVIQMLAQRASTNPELKLLMKIVASGSASPEQLRTFQDHIDGIKEIIKKEGSSQKSPNPPQQQMQTQINPAPPKPPAAAPQPAKFVSSGYQQTTFSASPQPKPATQKVPKNEVAGVAIEFNEPGASGDRYLFPRNSILEFKPGNKEMVASFLLVRKPNAGSSARYKPSEEYYQPVTLTISSDTPKVLETFGKAVAPADEVRKYMEDIMLKKKRANHAHLLLQLPVEADEVDVETSNRSTPMRPAQSRASESKAGLRASLTGTSTMAAAVSARTEEKVDTWQARRCQFCLKMVPSAAVKENGSPVCEQCHRLRRMDRLRNPFDSEVPLPEMIANEPPHYSGQQTLSI